MARKKKTTARLIEQNYLAEDIFDLRLETFLSTDIRPGQFVGMYPMGADALLPRPVSVCEADAENHILRIVYRLVGRGTAEFALRRPGEWIDLLGPLGNGFPVEEASGKRALLIGGGIGIPPLLSLARHLSGLDGRSYTGGRTGRAVSVLSVLGYRDHQTFLSGEFARYSRLIIASDDGSAGLKGSVIDAIRASGQQAEADVIFACGPTAMLRAVKAYAEERGIPAYLSLEEHMGCGIGACLACVCETKEINAHTRVRNARVCTEGPVFEAKEVVL